MTELLWRPMADAFLGVGVFVALLVAPFGWARLRWGHRIDDVLRRRRGLAPLAGAALTMPPGCGGAILVVSLHGRGAVSYGTAVAALVATMGDASWVLLAADPLLMVQIKALMLVVGAVTGYVVDALGLDPRADAPRAAAPAVPVLVGAAAVAPPTGPAAPTGRPGPLPGPVPGTAVPAVSLADASRAPVAVLWLLLVVGAALSIPATFRLLDPAALGPALGGVDPSLVVGCAGTLAALCYLLAGRGKQCPAGPSDMAGVLRAGAHDVAVVTSWVALAFVGWSLLSATTGFSPADLPLVGFVGVLVAALVGLVPGCALQIVFCGLFAAGGMPVSTFVANALSQDGDALIPMLALQPRSAVVAAAVTTVPALLVGTLLLLLT
ncbi:putative manganese transporter [Nocardioides sp. ChNu-99]|uniref:putative manganese transporter n=1 Tax=Nocardioides sp. ChNu-99 TaxID=2839897 RepID=UPI0024071806|nr:putative manganese transporter [Nocardioides sp. ChNu-99]MDF9716107.1 putative manganese transporter [Nocardioides sp. ChNu-99]